MNDWRLIPLEVKDGYWNMALDEATLEHVIGKKTSFTLRFYKWDPSTVSIGRNQSLSAEVDMNVAKNSGYNVVRRITGGGAVFHDKEREITYSIVCSIKFLEDLDAHTTLEQFEIIETGIVNGLRFYGLNPEKGVIHCPAIFLDGKKFSGNAQVRRKGYILQHGTILLDLNPEMMYSVLKAPFNVSKTKMVKSVYAKCIGVKEQLTEYNEKEFLTSLRKGFEFTLGINLVKDSFSGDELQMAKQLVREKYSNFNWLNKYA